MGLMGFITHALAILALCIGTYVGYRAARSLNKIEMNENQRKVNYRVWIGVGTFFGLAFGLRILAGL